MGRSKDDLLTKAIEEFQASLPEVDRVFDNEPCGDEHQNYSCSKEKSHVGDHIAHGYMAICARWPRHDDSEGSKRNLKGSEG